MPFCTQCGTQVEPAAAFCAKCGSRQPGAPAAAPPFPQQRKSAPGEEWLRDMAPSTAATLSYIPFVGWAFALFILASHRFRSDNLVRFHAFQGLYLAVVWLLIDISIGAFFGFAGIAARRAVTGSLKISVICAWVYMLIKTNQGEIIRLPFLGELADRSVAEHSAPRP